MTKQFQLIALGLTFFSSIASAKDDSLLYFPPQDGKWEQVTPTKAGWDKAKLDAALEFAGEQKSSGVVILDRGRILAERYWTPEKSLRYRAMLHGKDDNGQVIEDVASVQKSVAATLLGIALHNKLLKLDDPVSKHLGVGWSKADRDVEAKITLRHLITMTSGLSDKLEFQVAADKRWRYNTSAYARIVDVMEAATKMERNKLTQQWLTNSIGMKHSHWVVRPFAKSNPTSNKYGFATTARELARFGLLILAEGKWNGKTVVADQAYLRSMLQPSQKLNPSYGYLWWLNGQSHVRRAGGLRLLKGPLLPEGPKDMVAGLGALGRKVYVVPSMKLVVTRLGDGPQRSFDAEFWKRLMAAKP